RADRTGAALADHGSTAAWLGATAHVSPDTSYRDVHLARDLADALPETTAALQAGVLTPQHAQEIAGLRPAVADEVIEQIETHVVDFAAKTTPKETRRL